MSAHLREAWRHTATTKTALKAGIPVDQLRVDEVRRMSTGRVAPGAPVLAFRGIGSWGEMRDAVRSGSWKAKGGFNVHHLEGDTQVAQGIDDVLRSAGYHSLRGTGFLAIVEFDIQGLRFATMRTGYDPAKPPWIEGERGGLVVSPADPTKGVVYPDLGLGIGISELTGIPLDRIRRVYELDGKRIKRSMTLDEAVADEREMKLKDNSEWSGAKKVIVAVPATKTTKLHIVDQRQQNPMCGAKASMRTDLALIDPADVFTRPEQVRDFWRTGRTFVVRESSICRKCFVGLGTYLRAF